MILILLLGCYNIKEIAVQFLAGKRFNVYKLKIALQFFLCYNNLKFRQKEILYG